MVDSEFVVGIDFNFNFDEQYENQPNFQSFYLPVY